LEPKTETQTDIRTLYSDLITQYLPQDLDNFTLLKIAQFLSAQNQTQEAKEYYQAILSSSSIIKKIEAELGLAVQLASSENAQYKLDASKQLRDIVDNPFTPPAPRATAHYHILKLLKQNQDWKQIEPNALAYLEYPLEVKDHHLEILQLLALAYDKQGTEKLDLAISTYSHVWSISFSSIPDSAPALNRVCQLLWQRNNPADPAVNQAKSDRQLAYETAYKYIRKTKKLYQLRKDTFPETAIQTWQKIKKDAIQTYLKDPSIKPFPGNP